LQDLGQPGFWQYPETMQKGGRWHILEEEHTHMLHSPHSHKNVVVFSGAAMLNVTLYYHNSKTSWVHIVSFIIFSGAINIIL
jgi:hypothetical protein